MSTTGDEPAIQMDGAPTQSPLRRRESDRSITSPENKRMNLLIDVCQNFSSFDRLSADLQAIGFVNDPYCCHSEVYEALSFALDNDPSSSSSCRSSNNVISVLALALASECMYSTAAASSTGDAQAFNIRCQGRLQLASESILAQWAVEAPHQNIN